MAAPESRAQTPRQRRRSTIRIVKPGGSRTAAYTFLVAIATAAGLFFIWRFWQDDEQLVVARRALQDVRLEWKCPAGHRVRSPGQAQPRICPRCGKLSYPVGAYWCPDHGEFEASVRYSVTPEGVEEPETFRLDGGVWGPPETSLVCPKCNRPLQRVRENPFAGEAPQRKQRPKGQD